VRRLVLVIALVAASCSPDDPLYKSQAIFSPEGVKVGFAAPATVGAGNAGSIPVTSTTTTVTTPSEVDKFISPADELLNLDPPTTAAVSQYRGTVEVWRSEVESAVAHWGGDGDDVTRFLRIMECESGGNPLAKNPNSSASGLMQHLTRFWDERAAAAGMPGGDVFDGRTNIYVSAWLALAASGGGWQHWVCQ
jgi:hypothetical protein